MRVIIQRVKKASVEIESRIHSEIANGVLLLAGFEEADTIEDLEWMCKKIIQLRIFPDAEGVMNLPVQEVNGEILVVSQFTLHASTKKGNRPSYIRAARPETAVPLYEKFISMLEDALGKPVKSGIFGAMMDVALINEGPVTILIDTKNKE
ncbi:MAG: D-aminoacyl-tRNA deacylase [Bacteroidota bacterium]